MNNKKMRHWQHEFANNWGAEARLTQLDGEFDLNILAETNKGQSRVLKVMRPGCDATLIEMQIAALCHLQKHAPHLPFPDVIATVEGKQIANIYDETGQKRLCWALEKLPGKSYAYNAPKTPELIEELGQIIGECDAALQDFNYEGALRNFKWNLTQAGWVSDKLDCVTDFTRRTLISEILNDFTKIKPALDALPLQVIHNDMNDYNILVTGELNEQRKVSGIIDFGDMCAAPRICELAIAAAYIVLDHAQPQAALATLVAGYHNKNPLKPAELDLLWPLLRMRLAVSVVNSTLMAIENPDDPYVVISQAPAWRFLERPHDHPGLIQARMRAACGLGVTDSAHRVMAYLHKERGNFAPLMGQDLVNSPMGSLSVEHSTCPQNPFDLSTKEAARMGEEFENNGQIWLGYYCEPRLLYTAAAFCKGPWKASNRRTVHLAIDGFAPAGTPLFAPLAATVHMVENRPAFLDYGGVIILRHETPHGDSFYTLYGHLDPECCSRLTVGQEIAKGEGFCKLGDVEQSGGWAPHVHFQLAMTTDGMGDDWPGVADPDDLFLWQEIFPNPAALMNLPEGKTLFRPTDKSKVLAGRRAHFGKNLSLSYSYPVMLVRGWKHHMFDEWGRPYLDAYNNVPHVGHAHPRIQALAADQLKRMNSNTRYLHPAQVAFAEKILSKMPDQLEVCFFVNSGTEANELALRLARAHTGAKGMVTPDHGYHGNTTGAIDISAYKFNAAGGIGKSDWVELVEVADDYRGSFGRKDPDRAQKFANLVDDAITKLKAHEHGIAGFIAETFPSVGGQIIPPKGYLAAIYKKIRAAGGICIADEVQTGLGRLGKYYFGFEDQDVIPDIVVLGKPIGNGHPLGVLVTTRAIADSFSKGPEFFSTFGGSTLSCLIGKEVLDIVDDEGLQHNAYMMGERLLVGLRALEYKHDCIGDVRGMGLFIGVELITNSKTRIEGTEIATYVKNRMRAHRILIGSEGPKDNILKIRPPLTIDEEGVDMILFTLDIILCELASAHTNV